MDNNKIKKEYINMHSEVLNNVCDNFWRGEIVNILNRAINEADEEGRKFFINNPFDRFIICDDCYIMGYMPTLRKLICLNNSSVIHELDADDIPSAVICFLRLTSDYGYINGTYTALLSECSRRKDVYI